MKRSREDEANNGPRQSKISKNSSEMSRCSFCRKEFKARGLKRHQNYCKSKPTTESRVYKFCILNENVFEHIQGFLGNQTLTKLQSITGDHYPNCESHLSRFCCTCENDYPSIGLGRCLNCQVKGQCYFERFVNKRRAKLLYGINNFTEIPYTSAGWRHQKLYKRADLSKYMLKTCGSKMEWVRSIAKRDQRRKKQATIQRQRLAAHQASLKAEPREFRSYLIENRSMESDDTVLKCCSERFVRLQAALKERGLCLPTGSNVCKKFVMRKIGTVAGVVDTLERVGYSLQMC